jgi:hypothetical protein
LRKAILFKSAVAFPSDLRCHKFDDPVPTLCL